MGSKAQAELKQTRPFETAEAEAYVNILRTADALTHPIEQVLDSAGLSSPQYNVLRILESAKEDGVPTLEVAARMIEETPGVTRLLDRLEAKAYIRRQRCPRDRRQHLCWLSIDGVRLLDTLRPLVADAHDRVPVLT